MCQVIKNFKLDDVEPNCSVLFKKMSQNPWSRGKALVIEDQWCLDGGKKSFIMESHQMLADHCGIQFDKFDLKSFKCLGYINGSTWKKEKWPVIRPVF